MASNKIPKGIITVRLKFDVPPEKFEAFSGILADLVKLLQQPGIIPAKKLSGKAKKTRQDITKHLQGLLTTPGRIKTGQAWDICRKYGYGYGIVLNAFRELMEVKVSEGKALKLDRGKWEILKE